MSVLQICLKPPLPAVDGGCMAMNNITQGLLRKGIEVKVLALSTQKHPFQKELLDSDYLEKTRIENVYVDTEVKLKDAFLNLFTSDSYNIERFYSQDFEALIIKTLKESKFDIVLLESLYVTPYLEVINQSSKAKIVYRSHNIEHEIWERNAQLERGPKKRYLTLLAKRLRKYEKAVISQFDGIAAITQKDKATLNKLGGNKVEVIPFGINALDYKSNKEPAAKTLFHIGSMDWLPNVSGIKWFLKEVWGELIKKNDTLVFKVAGRQMPEWMTHYTQRGVVLEGEVDSAVEFINQNGIMIVPLFAGSGMRIKIIEAMALGKLVIATSIALEGIECEHQKTVIVANNKKEFIEAIGYYFENVEKANEIGDAARELVKTNYDNQVIVDNLVQFFKQV